MAILFDRGSWKKMSCLVVLWSTCMPNGIFTKAQNVLEELPVRNVISWSALIAGYCQQGKGQEALGCFQRMRSEGLSLDGITYACILKACSISQEMDIGKTIHDEIASKGILEKDVVLGNALVNMYVKCGALAKAQSVFDELPLRDAVSWNSLIAGHAQHGQGEEALYCFYSMRKEGLSPNAITYACILKACGITQEADIGEQMHVQILSRGISEKNMVLGSALVDMYVKCGALAKAQKVFDKLRVRNIASWNALIAGYGLQGQGLEALGCFQRMCSEGFSPDPITYACTLKACSISQEIGMGERIHDEIASQGLLENCGVLGNALVDMYVKCGALTKAQNVFNQLRVRDVISWAALIAGYVQHGQVKEALGFFQRMQIEGLSPDPIAYASILKCGIVQAAEMVEQMLGEFMSQNFSKKDVGQGSDSVDMYAKCGAFAKAHKVFKGFNELPVRDEVSWSPSIA